ncbi:SusD/RagB family nutrient-binding outer membrane lipoprotein [Spirosoma sp. KCTC 42546]|uniref:SusD/RagB family nutrient-binding outer membrane lipoprotein n=1 Tax=Spirosoma sp. KCTC 42546 TaxID=2520506 RepID=UPI00115AD94D|nr:SusD/RagB family nutrient-binding outer membrane lipoprotein [Spirosoma sp. KCTC 42546]QDK80907.1 SusD/RagB family nutrient-binding outer membrane lipoprotein [Spirosoma sp. KCTC 42546]
MKFIDYKSYLLIPLFLGLGACSQFLDVNVTPNNPTSVTPAVLLPGAQAGTAFANANELNRFASTLVQQLAGAANNPQNYDIFQTNGADMENQWRFELYGGGLVNYQKLIELADANNAKAYSGIAKIMKAYTFSIATDFWGDVPYSQALQGETFTAPRLDKQEDIYKGNATLGIQSLFDLVREGIRDLDATSTVKPGADDLIYGGDLAKWKRAGNTLLLKFAMTISRKESALATSVINEVLTGNNYINTNSGDMNFTFGASVGSQDPRYTYTVVSTFKDDIILSTRYLNLLNSLNDPRLPLFFTKPAANYVTIDNGFRGTLPSPVTNWSRYNKYVTGNSGEGPVRLITNFQRAFILAEAALRLGTPGDPQALYKEGITASMTLAGLTADQIAAYFTANPTVATLAGTTEEKIAQVITQKYIAFTGNGLELWNDYRRTGYPVLQPSQNAAGIDGTRPVRAVYINNEIQRNPNFPNPAPQSNVRVWWDVD